MVERSRDPRCSVVIPTHDRWSSLERVVAALGRQTLDREDFEVIVVDDGSSDGTSEKLASLTPPFALQLITQPNSGPAAARNRGIDRARGDLVVFLDDDVLPTPEWLEQHLAAHRSGGPKLVVIGPMLTPVDHDFQPWVRWEQSMLERSYQSMRDGEWKPTGRHFFTGNVSLPRTLFAEVGRFDESLRRAEDVELGYRLDDAGATFSFHYEACGHHYARRSLDSWLDMASSYGAADVRFATEDGRRWLLPTVASEFHERRMPTRRLVYLAVGRDRSSRLAEAVLVGLARRSTRVSRRVSEFGFSGVFNLRYYNGLASALGGRSVFLELVESHAPPVRLVAAR